MMRSRSWRVLIVGFGALLILMGLYGYIAVRRAQRIYAVTQSAYENHRYSQQALAELRSGIYLAGLCLRDYLLDPSNLGAGRYREQFAEVRASTMQYLKQLRTPTRPEETLALGRLEGELEAYFGLLAPVFEWTPQQKLLLSSQFLREQVLPRRKSVLAMALDVRDLNRAHFAQQREELARSQEEWRAFLNRMTALSLALGAIVAAASILRITRLETRNRQHQRRTEQAEQELRRLSQQLVQAQENERKLIARELHDQVGQMLTAVRMELGSLLQLPDASEGQFQIRVREARQITEQALRAVRDLAMGLRPSMLDDLGLVPAIEWQARDFSRRAGVPVTVQVEGRLEDLSEAHRTSVFRIVQEALTNCARHARAQNIRISLHGRDGLLLLEVQDDGVGFGPRDSRGKGLGLIGMEERVGELGGKIEILSQPRQGTLVRVELPVTEETKA
jgi:signal transduction histidine kinase